MLLLWLKFLFIPRKNFMINKNKRSRILAVITARGGSKGLPGKNIKKLGGMPLIVYTIKTAQKSKYISDLILSTDSVKIAKICKKYGLEAPYIQPSKLSTDKSGHLEVMQYAIAFMEKKLKITYDYVTILQPTSPFRSVGDIDNTLKLLIKSKADSAVSIVKVEAREHPIKIKKLVDNKIEPYCMTELDGLRRQDFPVAYKRSGAVYAMRRDTIMKKGQLYGKTIVGFEVPKDRSIDIDTQFDWFQAVCMLKDLKSKGYNW